MDLSWWYHRIQDFQTLIAAAVGFAGVAWTIRSNAKAARDQRDEERRLERQALRVALIEEMEINRNAAAGDQESVRDGSTDTAFAAQTNIMDDAFEAFSDKIGVLTETEVRLVMHAYLQLRTSHAMMAGLSGVEVHEYHMLIPGVHRARVASIVEQLIEPFDSAVNTLSEAKELDVGR